MSKHSKRKKVAIILVLVAFLVFLALSAVMYLSGPKNVDTSNGEVDVVSEEITESDEEVLDEIDAILEEAIDEVN